MKSYLKNISIFVFTILLLSNVSLGLNVSTTNNNSNFELNNSLIYKLNNSLTNTTNNSGSIIINNTTDTNKEKNECYLNITINGYRVIVKTNGEVFGFANKTPLKFIKIGDNEYIISPIVLNVPIEIYSKFNDKILHRTVILNYTKPEKEKKRNKHKKRRITLSKCLIQQF